MDRLQIFKSSESGEVRTVIGADGEPRFCLAGFSEKIFDVLRAYDQDPDALLNEIENLSF